MNLHFLGTTGYHPNNRRQTACMMLPEIGVIFDAGTGIFRVRDLIQTDTLDIFLSHIHLDHCIGLTFMFDVLFQKESTAVTVHVDESKISVLEDHLYHQQLFPVKPNYQIVPLKKRTELGSGHSLESFPIKHPGGCHGFRIQGDDIDLAYVTDTTASTDSEYVSHIKNVNTLIHECYFPDGWEEKAKLTGHSCLTPVAKVAAAAKAEKTFLVHINPLNEEAVPLDLNSVADVYPNLIIAEDHMVIDVSLNGPRINV
ncbi:MAG: MBL fold metallo-hydrolase [Planctomycetota bacterium]